MQTLDHSAHNGLVLEGGFHPDDITPRPPFVVETKKGRKGGRVRNILKFDPKAGGAVTALEARSRSENRNPQIRRQGA